MHWGVTLAWARREATAVPTLLIPILLASACWAPAAGGETEPTAEELIRELDLQPHNRELLELVPAELVPAELVITELVVTELVLGPIVTELVTTEFVVGAELVVTELVAAALGARG